MSEIERNQPTTNSNDPKKDPLHAFLNEAGRSISYRPILRQLVGDENAAILLQQIIFHYVNKGHKQFYKFVEPSRCHHPLYREGDSWTEELEFSKDTYDTARKKIATRKNRKHAHEVLAVTQPTFGPSQDRRCKNRQIMTNRDHLVVYWREADNKLVFVLNEQLLINALNILQAEPEMENALSESGFSTSVNGEKPHTYNIEYFKENKNKQEIDIAGLQEAQPVQVSGIFFNEDKNHCLNEVISQIWNTTAPGMIQKLKQTLLGLHVPGSSQAICNIEPPVTAEELEQFGGYYHQQNPTGDAPTAPDKIQHWIYKFRASMSNEQDKVLETAEPQRQDSCGTELELFLSEQLEWPYGPIAYLKRALSSPMKYDDGTMGNLPTPNEAFESNEDYKGWLLDAVLPWYTKQKNGHQSSLAHALRKFDWYSEYVEKQAQKGEVRSSGSNGTQTPEFVFPNDDDDLLGFE